MKNLYLSFIFVFCATFLFGQNNDFTNGGGDGLWSNTANWSLGSLPSTSNTVRTVNAAESFVDQNFTVFRLQNTFGTAGDRFVNSTGGGVLTIDTNSASDAVGIQNVSNSNVKLNFRGAITINDTGNNFTKISMSNGATNSIEFEAGSLLTLTTRAEVSGGSSNDFLFNGEIAGSGNLRVGNGASATFGSTSSNPSYTGEIVFLANSSLIVNTADNNTFYSGLKLQVNGNNTSIEINGENVFDSGITVGGTNTFTFDVNKNQDNMTNIIFQGAGTLNLDVDAAVTNLVFADNSGSAWDAGATLNIVGFQDGVIRFGTDSNGLTAQQLSQITAAGVTTFALDANGFLFNAITLSTNDIDANIQSVKAYPTVVSDNIYFTRPQNNVQIIGLNGNVVLSKTLDNQSEIAVDFLAPGFYFVVFENNNVQKFIKQ